MYYLKRILCVCTVNLLIIVLVSSVAAATKLTMVTRRLTQTKPAIELFNAKMADDGVNLTVELVHAGIDKITVMMAGGAPPDMLDIDLIHGPKLMALGLLQGIDDFINRDDMNDFVEGLVPAMVRVGQWKGDTYLLPLWTDNSMLYYNKTRLSETGIPAQGPRTWDDMVSISKKTTDAQKDFYAFQQWPHWGGGCFWFKWLPFLWGNGGRLLNDEGTKCIIDGEPALQALQLWYDLVNVYRVTRPTAGTKFADGLDTFRIQGADVIAELHRSNPDLWWGVVPIPTRLEDQTPSSFVGGATMGITAATEHPREAWEVMKFLLSEEVQVNIIAAGGLAMPVHRDYVHNPYFGAAHLQFAEGTFLANSRCPYSIVYKELGIINGDFSKALRGEVPLKQILTTMERKLNAVIKEGAVL